MRKVLVCSLILWLQGNSLFSFGQGATVQTDTLPVVQTTEDKTVDPAFSVLGPGEAVVVRTVPQQRIDSFLKEDDFWYANTAPAKEKKEAERNSRAGKSLLDRAWFRQLLWVIILTSFIAVVLWYLYTSNILLFRRGPKKITGSEEGEELTEDIFALNYEKELANAIAAKDFRLAVRLWYLRTLKDLSDRGLIDYRFGRTNNDYVSQLYNTGYHQSFSRLTRAFEYTWYGQFNLSPRTYEMMQTDFMNFKKALG